MSETDITIGMMLKQKRNALGLGIEEVSHALCIKSRYLVAIELDQIDQLPSDVYARGYTKVYGEYLGVDVIKTLPDLSPYHRAIKHFIGPARLIERNYTKSVFLSLLLGLFLVISYNSCNHESDLPYVLRKVLLDSNKSLSSSINNYGTSASMLGVVEVLRENMLIKGLVF